MDLQESTQIKPNPDIAGIGVILSFVVIGSAIMVLGICQLWRCEREFFKLSTLFRPPKIADREAEDIDGADSTDALGNTLFSLADTQSATGIAICVAALATRDITVYHFALCDEMGWMALITSTIGFLSARREVLDAAFIFKRTLRIIAMWTLFSLLIAMAAQRNDFIDWHERVYEHGPSWDTSNWRVRLSIILLVVSGASALIDTALTVPGRGTWVYYMTRKLVNSILARFREAQPFREWFPVDNGDTDGILAAFKFVGSCLLSLAIIPVLLALYLVCLCLYWSMVHPVTTFVYNLGFFLWGAHDVFYFRREGQAFMLEEERGEEDEVGFGQVVALTLLISPIIANADLWYVALRNKAFGPARVNASGDDGQKRSASSDNVSASARTSEETLRVAGDVQGEQDLKSM